MNCQELSRRLHPIKAVLKRVWRARIELRGAAGDVEGIQSNLQSLEEMLGKLERAARQLKRAIKALPPAPVPVAGQVVKAVKMALRSALNTLEAFIERLERPHQEMTQQADRLADLARKARETVDGLDDALATCAGPIEELEKHFQ